MLTTPQFAFRGGRFGNKVEFMKKIMCLVLYHKINKEALTVLRPVGNTCLDDMEEFKGRDIAIS